VILEYSAILALAAQCAPSVAPATMLAIVRTESGGFIHALNVNGTKSPPRPKDQASAAILARRYIAAGYSVDLGLAQINSRNLSRLGMTIEDALDPCRSLASGASILTQNFVATSSDQQPQARLRVALSMYNTGSRSRGFSNGYVGKVLANAGSVAVRSRDIPTGAAAKGMATAAATDQFATPQSAHAETLAPPDWDVFARADYAAHKNSNAKGE
jgi:type IV secretion system protein VirB1